MKPGISWCFACAVATASLSAQGLQLPTEVVDPLQNQMTNNEFSGLTLYVPLGPLAFPLGLTFPGSPPLLSLTRAGDTLSIAESAFASSNGSYRAQFVTCNLVTRVVPPLPARVPLVMAATSGSGMWLPLSYSVSAAVDVGNDGATEFASGYPAAPAVSRIVLADARGTPVRWKQVLSIGHYGLPASFGGTLDLRFTAPVQEPAYGPVCEGELGCQLVPNAPFARVLVASLPTDTTYAWLVGGDQQQNLQFPGFGCPLLCNPLVVIAVPLIDGANGRKMVDFDAVFPPLPGMVWFAQCIAVSAGTFVGTNGVRIQT